MQQIAFPTIHGKQDLLAGLFAQRLGWRFLVPEVDTDRFGTFAGEVARTGTPRETVLAKARAGAEAAGVSAAIASEGTIGPNPAIPLFNTDQELIAYVDIAREIEFVQSHLSAQIVAVRETWHPELDLDSLAQKAQLPAHGLIVRTERDSELIAYKGIHTPEQLRDVVFALANKPEAGEIIIESDFRANHSPTRQANILACAEKLVARLQTLCPNCQTLGWGNVCTVTGLPCELCGDEVERAIRAEISGCLSCDYRVELPIGSQFAKASSCDYCNP